MEDLLANPAVRAALAPFVAALAAAAALRHTRLQGLAIALAFAVVIGLTTGFSFETLTASRKMVLAGLASALVLLVLELRRISPSAAVRAVLAAAAAAAAVWMVWRVLQQQDASRAAMHGIAAAAYMALLLESSLRGPSDGVRAASVSMVLALAAGALALLGASASLAQVGIAVAAGSGAVLLAYMTSLDRGPAGWTLVLPAAAISGLVGLLAVFTGALAWFCLLPTLAVPWAARLAPREGHAPWSTAVLASLAAVIPLSLAAGLAWYTSRISA